MSGEPSVSHERTGAARCIHRAPQGQRLHRLQCDPFVAPRSHPPPPHDLLFQRSSFHAMVSGHVRERAGTSQRLAAMSMTYMLDDAQFLVNRACTAML